MLVDDRPVSAFYVDVNAADEHGKVGTTMASVVEGYEGKPDPSVGEYAWAVDADDNACRALVTERQGEWLQLHMDESLWLPLDRIRSGVELERDPDERVSLRGVDPEEALRAMLRTPPAKD